MIWNNSKFLCQPRQAVMTTKRLQTRTEEEIEQLLRDTKFSMKFWHLWFELTFMICVLFYVQITEICNILQ